MSKLRLSHVVWVHTIFPMYLGLSPGSIFNEFCTNLGGRCKEVHFSQEVTNCKQADIDFRGHEEIYSEPGGVMDYEEDRSRPKRRRHPIG
ncbi:hypothetical protein CMV_027665 [Castanea mollissima]|uniref:Uncharacterized protein n=1 Tax=Castanea mollissima TaxID=60419 RepID=A0A8J4QHL7_9ROSI|nr:hypothetical protein CMV_027665 [Castanea mollissima]